MSEKGFFGGSLVHNSLPAAFLVLERLRIRLWSKGLKASNVKHIKGGL